MDKKDNDPYVTKEICDVKMESLRREIKIEINSIKWVIVTTVSLSTCIISLLLLFLR